MINKKEDLYGTEFTISNKDEAQMLQDLCGSFGIEIGKWSGCRYTGGVMRGLVGFDLGTNFSCKLVFTSKLPGADTMEEFKLLRKVDISELTKEPKRTKVEYVRINPNDVGGKYWEVVKEWAESDCSNIHYSHDGSFLAVSSNQILLDEYCGGNLFRRIETSIEWWEDAAMFASGCNGVEHVIANSNGISIKGELTRDEACDFARILLEQGE